jgi:hypothetical protein
LAIHSLHDLVRIFLRNFNVVFSHGNAATTGKATSAPIETLAGEMGL